MLLAPYFPHWCDYSAVAAAAAAAAVVVVAVVRSVAAPGILVESLPNARSVRIPRSVSRLEVALRTAQQMLDLQLYLRIGVR